jgi:hypothetical protein
MCPISSLEYWLSSWEKSAI